MKTTTFKPTTIEECADILDWFNDDEYEYLVHIALTKHDAQERLDRALPSYIEYTSKLIADHAGTEEAYPVELLNQPT